MDYLPQNRVCEGDAVCARFWQRQTRVIIAARTGADCLGTAHRRSPPLHQTSYHAAQNARR
jgi:hypothetical protein